MSQGDEQSARRFAATCASVAPRLACLATGITGHRDSAEDIVQQAISIAIEKDQRFKTENEFVSWLAGIVKHCALNHRRKRIRRKTQSTDPTTLVSVTEKKTMEVPIDQQTGQLLPMQTSFDDRLQHALQSLSDSARSCLLLRTVQQLSYKEISELLDVSESAAMNMVHRSKKALRTFLSGHPGSSKSQESSQ